MSYGPHSYNIQNEVSGSFTSVGFQELFDTPIIWAPLYTKLMIYKFEVSRHFNFANGEYMNLAQKYLMI